MPAGACRRKQQQPVLCPASNVCWIGILLLPVVERQQRLLLELLLLGELSSGMLLHGPQAQQLLRVSLAQQHHHLLDALLLRRPVPRLLLSCLVRLRSARHRLRQRLLLQLLQLLLRVRWQERGLLHSPSSTLATGRLMMMEDSQQGVQVPRHVAAHDEATCLLWWWTCALELG